KGGEVLHGCVLGGEGRSGGDAGWGAGVTGPPRTLYEWLPRRSPGPRALVMISHWSIGIRAPAFGRVRGWRPLASAGTRCHPWRSTHPSDPSGPAIHGRAFANAVDADRASTRPVRSPLVPPAAQADGGEDHRGAGGDAAPQMEAGQVAVHARRVHQVAGRAGHVEVDVLQVFQVHEGHGEDAGQRAQHDVAEERPGSVLEYAQELQPGDEN